VEIQAETGNIHSDTDKENNSDDDDYFPTVEEILYAALRKDGFATEDSSPDHTVRGIDEVAPEGTGVSAAHSRSKSDDGSGASRSEHAHYPSIIELKLPFLLFLPLTLFR
jgi:hypothetical protein